MSIQLTAAIGDYDLTRPLISGNVSPKGVDLTVLDYASPQRHRRMLESNEFDVCEMSMGSYLASRESSDEFPFTAIPVFPHRRFRHSYMFQHSDADIRDPGDLTGKKVGLRGWQITSGIWMRGIAREHYGADLESMEWYVHDSEDVELSDQRFTIRSIDGGERFEEMLIEGELDAALYPNVLASVRSPHEPVERIFADSVAEERRYFEQTGLFPIMHTVVVKDEVLSRHPWVAVNILQAFRESRDVCLRKLEDPRWTALAWARQHLEEQQSVLGENPWPFGISADNRENLEKLMEYAKNQGIIPKTYRMDELFATSTLDDELQEKKYASGVDS